MVEEDGVVLFDETDDQFDDIVKIDDDIEMTSVDIPEGHDPNIVEGMYLGGIVKDKNGYRLKENEEIFTDEYMRQYDRYITEKGAKQRRVQNIISVGVILGCIAVIAFFFWLFL